MGNGKGRTVQRAFKRSDAAKLALAAVFIGMVFVPIVHMLAFIDRASLEKALSSPQFVPSLTNSLKSAGLATAITVALAYFLAVCVERVDLKWKGFFSVVFILPMLIPSISHGMSLVFLFGNNGILTNLFGFQAGIYGLRGIVVGSVMYAFPVAYLMLADIMRYQDGSPYEAADVLGIPPARQFARITLPYLRKPLISVVFATFTMIITDYGVPLMIGGKFTTLPVVLYHEVIGQLNFGKGSVYGVLLLLPAVAAFLIDVLNKDRGNSGFVTVPFKKKEGRGKRAAAFAFSAAVSIFTLIPVVSFLVLAFVRTYPSDMAPTLAHFRKLSEMKATRYLLNSLEISVLVSAAGVAIAFLTAYMASRMRSRLSGFLHLSAMSSVAIPGIVLGLSYVLTFKGTFLQGTLAVMVMVNTVHFMSSPYLMMYNSLSKLNENLEAVGQTLGVSRIRMIADIFAPMCRSTFLEMFSYFFVNCMMTISAVSFLASTATKPISLMINQFEAQMQLECAAVVALLILAVNLALKALVALLQRRPFFA